MWNLRSQTTLKFMFSFLYVYTEDNKFPNLLIRFPDHCLGSLLFPRTTCKISYTLLSPQWTPTHLAKHQNNYLTWQLVIFHLIDASFHQAILSSLLNSCTTSLVSFLPPLLHFYALSSIIFSIAFLFYKLCFQGVFAMSLRSTGVVPSCNIPRSELEARWDSLRHLRCPQNLF